ncbi:MAG TPA: enoyl-CoA hydratase [Pseudonocardia sp.]|jgi:enoyl-CoA hydratase|nr:enoyl-CoA hydratase [Pseudonocardia sp.]
MPDETNEPVVLQAVDGPVATITLNRPGARNAISVELLDGLRAAMAAADADESVEAVVLTGTDPAFCAGVDLKQIGDKASGLFDTIFEDAHSPWPPISKPVIAAVNGPAITGGLELVLNCDIVICSERARFADTHARVGVLPGWGLTVLLPLAVGRSRARQMSLTGDLLTAAQAHEAGLVTEVLPHAQLLARATEIASSIANNNARAVRALLSSYRAVESEFVAGGYDVEGRTARVWGESDLDLAESGRRRAALMERARSQTS